jgi:anthraniloyl-CoA monooxygenase
VRIAVAGGGPGGLYFAVLARQLLPGAEITVWERNAPDDTFGFGVVFSDETLGGIENADPGIYRQMEREFARWDDIDVHYRGEVITSGGHGFAAMGRRRLLEILQQRCARRDCPLPHPRARSRRARGELRPGGRRRRRQLSAEEQTSDHVPSRI